MVEKDSIFLGHVACTKHGGSDSLGLYRKVDEDGNECIDGMCFSECGFMSREELKEYDITDGGNNVLVDFVVKASGKSFIMTEEIKEYVQSILDLPIKGWKERRIPTIVSEFYGVRTKVDDSGEITHRYYPSTESGELVGWHVRDRKVKEEKNAGGKPKRPPFYPIGKVRSDCELFGQSLFSTEGKFNNTLVITAGEEDAQAVFTALNTETVNGSLSIKNYITPVVSTTTGEASLKQLKKNYDFISAFDSVVIIYDNDDAGVKGAEKVARLFKAGQARIAKLLRNDACEYTSNNDFHGLRKAYYEAEQFSPVDVLHLAEMWEDFENDDLNEKIPFPSSWVEVNELFAGGAERGEVTVIGAHTSIGKSTLVNNLVYNWIENTKYKVGVMYLEGTKREVVRDLLSLDACVNLRVADRSKIDMQELKRRFFTNLVKRDQFVYVDHQGSLSNDKIFQKLNYLAKAENCDIIVVDPLQACVNSSENGQIIEFMDTILKFAKETNTSVYLVSHMKKPDSDDPHDVTEYDLLGCVDRDTEFLTPNGWKKICDFTEDDLVLNYDIETGESEFEKPESFVKLPCDSFYHMKSIRGVDMMLSKEHRVIFQWNKNWDRRFIVMEDLYQRHLVSTTGFTGRFPTTFSLKDEAKTSNEIPGCGLWCIDKNQAEIIFNEVFVKDGKERNVYNTTCRKNADFIQYVCTILGKRSRIYTNKKGGVNQKDVFQVRYAKSNTVSIANKDSKPEIAKVDSVDGFKYCFTTSTGAWVARRNGCIFPTGNSSSINQIAFNTILASRDKMHENHAVRNSTKLQVPKCRRTGLTGVAGWLRYDHETTHLVRGFDPYEAVEHDELSESDKHQIMTDSVSDEDCSIESQKIAKGETKATGDDPIESIEDEADDFEIVD